MSDFDVDQNARDVLAIRNSLTGALNRLSVKFTTGQVVSALVHLVAETIVAADDPAAARAAVFAALDSSIEFETEPPCAH